MLTAGSPARIPTKIIRRCWPVTSLIPGPMLESTGSPDHRTKDCGPVITVTIRFGRGGVGLISGTSRIMSVMKALELIGQLSLLPHPEGGWYREVYRSRERVQTRRGLRSALTTIHYLLEQQQLSRWHVVESAEIWHFYDGAPLELFEYVPATRHLTRHLLGGVPDGNESVVVIEAGVWQAARSRGDFSLVGCTVGPGFEFEDFRFVTALSDHEAHFTGGELEELAHLL